MTYIANVELTATFNAWRNTTNQLAEYVTKSANTSTGVNNVVANNFIALLTSTLAGVTNLSGNVEITGTPRVQGSALVVSSNTTFDSSAMNVSANVVLNSTGSVKVPEGTTAERTGTANGHFRYNKTTGGFEGYIGSGYEAFVVTTDIDGTYVTNSYFQATYTTADVQAKAALANTNTYIATKLDTSTYTTADVQAKAALANTNAAIASAETKAIAYSLIFGA